MSSKTQTTQTQANTYDPTSMSSYQSLQSPATNLLLQYMQDPAKSGMFQLRFQQARDAANQMGQQGASQIMQNLVAGGFGGGNMNAFSQAALNANSRATSGNISNAYIQNLLGQQQLQQQAMNSALSYRPLQTGMTGSSTQTTSGLGTWLPQLTGAAIGAVAGGGLGSFGSLGNMFGGGGGGGMNFNPMAGVSSSNPFFGSNPFTFQGANPSPFGPSPFAGLGGNG